MIAEQILFILLLVVTAAFVCILYLISSREKELCSILMDMAQILTQTNQNQAVLYMMLLWLCKDKEGIKDTYIYVDHENPITLQQEVDQFWEFAQEAIKKQQAES